MSASFGANQVRRCSDVVAFVVARRRTSRNDSETIKVQFVVSTMASYESSLGDVAAGKNVNGTC